MLKTGVLLSRTTCDCWQSEIGVCESARSMLEIRELHVAVDRVTDIQSVTRSETCGGEH